MTVSILISRLRRAYWPTWCARIRLSACLRAEPIATWAAEGSRRRQTTAYDYGRIRWFMEQIESGQPIDPIEVETEWMHSGAPNGLEIYDGHHRFMAAVFLRRRRIPATVGGLVDLKEWLTGERRRWPL